MHTNKCHPQQHTIYRGEDLCFFWSFTSPFLLHAFEVFHPLIPDTTLALFVREFRIGDRNIWGVDTYLPLHALPLLRFIEPVSVPAHTLITLAVSKLQRSATEDTLVSLLPVGVFVGEV